MCLLEGDSLVEEGEIGRGVDSGDEIGLFVGKYVVEQPLDIVPRAHQHLPLVLSPDVALHGHLKAVLLVLDLNNANGLYLSIGQLVCYFDEIIVHFQVII